MLRKLLLLWLCCLPLLSAMAQGHAGHDHGKLPLHERRCATMKVDSARRLSSPGVRGFDERAYFEKWIAEIIEEKKKKEATMFTIGAVYTIPVVFHIIHNGEAVGTNYNIPYAQLRDQITVLNEDFRRMAGTDGFNTNPVGADTRIEFCLAKRRPDGSAFPGGEDGVNRINRTTGGFLAHPHTTGHIDGTIKPWTSAVAGSATRGYSTDQYLNIWITEIAGGILGYAQFPQATMHGMPCTAQTANTDGLVFDFRSVGDVNKTSTPQLVAGAPYNGGRTATHEVGHWLGLVHIWADNPDCVDDDFCADTPMAASENFGCPVGANSCPGPGNDMIENYMDYTDDACMNIFTIDQRSRMRAVLESSPRRKSLLQSVACIPPFASDASITEVLAPSGVICGTSITPQVTIKNFGTSNLTSAVINYQLDGGAILTFNWAGSLTPGSTFNQTLPIITGLSNGAHTFRAFSTLPNGVADPNTTMDESQNSFYINGFPIPYSESFAGEVFPPAFWSITNGGQCPTWVGANITQIDGSTGQAAGEYTFSYTPGTGDNDDLFTPVITIPAGSTGVQLVFDVAHAPFDGVTNDRLRVNVSTDCGATYSATASYDKTSNTGLATRAALTSNFFPSGPAEWRTETVDLSSFVNPCGGADRNLRFRFRITNAFGNNIYVDNVRVNGTTPPEIGVTESSVNVPDGGAYAFGATNTGTPITRTFTIANTGGSALNLSGFTVTGTGFSGVAPPASIAAGSTGTFTITFNPTCGSSAAFSGNVTFNNNDCDENPYNFTLSGSTNACNISLLAAGAQTACVPATNTYTQQVIVTYVNPPCTGTLDVNGQSFPITSSPQTVTLVGLTANGLAVSTTAAFSAAGACTRTTASLFTAPVSCLALSCTLTSSDADNIICAGQSVTFTATGGTNYEFKINGITVQNSATATYTTTTLASGDVVSVVVTSGATITTVYTEDFESGAATWTLNTSTGAEGADPNFWQVDDDEGGVAPTGCGVANNNDETLHITSVFNPGGGASYDAGGLCGLLFCPQTNRRAESGNINTTAHTGMTLKFNYIANGAAPNDRASVVIFDGTSWSTLTATLTAPVCPSTQGRWTAYSAALPAAFEGKTNARIGFIWQNNDDGVGTDPSVAINNIVIDKTTGGTPCNPASIAMTVNPAVTPSVTATASPGTTICAGTNVTFTANPTNGGTTPTYQWQLNGVNIVGAVGSTYSTATLVAGDQIRVIMTSSNPCASPTTATSPALTITVTASLVPSVTIAAVPAGAICAGTSVTFTATPTNGGATPTYQWQLNGVNIVGAVASTFTSTTLANGDQIRVVMTSSDACASPASATSTAITMTVNPVVTPSVTIAAVPAGAICAGTSVTFTATPTNGGAAPTYQWQLNGVNIVGAVASTFTSTTLANGDQIRVVMTSNAACPSPASATSTAITMTVNPIPTITLSALSSVCTGATSFNLGYSATTGSPNQYSLSTVAPTPMPGFVAIVNAALPASPISVAVPVGTAAGTYNFNLTVRNSTTGCVSTVSAFTVTIGDVTAPTITCPATQTLTLNATCNATIPSYTALATGLSDNCTPVGSIVVTQSPVAGTAVSGTGTTVVTLTATDASGNASNCTFNVNRVDNTAPVITCPANVVVVSAVAAVATFTAATATDNCTAVPTVTQTAGLVSGSVFPLGVTNITYQATDAAGNSSTCSFTVTVGTSAPVGASFAAPPSPPCIWVKGLDINKMEVNWCDASSSETGYEIYRKKGVDGAYGLVATVPAQFTSLIQYIDEMGLESDTRYFYMIITKFGSEKSHPSDDDDDFTYPIKPTVVVTQDACLGSNGLMTATAFHKSGEFYWYESATAETPVLDPTTGKPFSGSVFNTGQLFADKMYWVTAKGEGYESKPRVSVTVKVKSLPTAVLLGSKTQFSCTNSYLLSAESIAGASYTWFLNNMAVATTTTPSFTATKSGSYTMSVTSNGCFAGSTAVRVVLNYKPEAKILEGSATTICAGGSLNAKTFADATYEWFLGSALAGTGSSLPVNASGIYTLVVTRNGCSASAESNVKFGELPSSIDISASSTEICPSGTTELSAPSVSGATYEWFRNGRREAITSTNTLETGKTGVFTVLINNGGCTGTSGEIVITRVLIPSVKIVGTGFNELTVKASDGSTSTDIKWFLNGEEVPEFAGKATITPTKNGNYKAVWGVGGCSTESSNIRFVLSVLGMDDESEDAQKAGFKFYPNPTQKDFFITLPTDLKGGVRVELIDELGRVLQAKESTANGTAQTVQLDMGALANGMYAVRITTEGSIYTTKVIKE